LRRTFGHVADALVTTILDGMGRIVVGVDETAASLHALEWAIATARSTGDFVHAVHAQRTGFHRDDNGFLAISPSSRRQAHAVIEDALATVAPSASGVEVITEVVTGRPGQILVRAGQGASLIVIGECESTLRRGCANAEYVMKHAQCPVVVVPLRHTASL
jgi:nucleotide-binding universal stress UspA family protein